MNDLSCWETKFESCCYSEQLLIKLSLINEQVPIKDRIDLLEIKKAIYYAKKYHGNQRRESGEVYYSHPLQVAYMVADYIFETNALVTSILHDVLEDTELTKEKVCHIFGSLIADQVDSLTRVKIDRKINAAELLELLREQKKHVLLIIKLLDRVHNIQTLFAKPPEFQNRTILETLINFLPMAVHLSLFDIEKILDQTCFGIISKKLHIHNEEIFVFEGNYQPLFREPQNI